MHKINEKYAKTRQTIKAKTDYYNNSQNYLKLKKSQSKALFLMKQDYKDLVKTKNEMIITDYLCTMLCFVPTGKEKEFESEYMNLA